MNMEQGNLIVYEEFGDELYHTTNAWHYTNIKSAIRIIDSRRIFATTWDNKNDPSEVVHGLSFIKDAWDQARGSQRLSWPVREVLEYLGPIEQYVNSMDWVCSFSLTRAVDDLTQWRAYARRDRLIDGVSLKFATRPDFPYTPDTDSFPKGQGSYGSSFQWLRVVYDEEMKRKISRELVSHIIKIVNNNYQEIEERAKFIRILTLLVASQLKHGSFATEQEVRLVMLAHSIELPYLQGDKKKRYVPYRAPMRSTEFSADGFNASLPIQEVMLSNGVSEKQEEYLRGALSRNYWANIPVTRTNSPATA